MIKGFYTSFHETVEDVKENAERESGERILGKSCLHPFFQKCFRQIKFSILN